MCEWIRVLSTVLPRPLNPVIPTNNSHYWSNRFIIISWKKIEGTLHIANKGLLVSVILVGAVREIYIVLVFGSDSFKSTIFGIDVAWSILFRFLTCVKTNDPPGPPWYRWNPIWPPPGLEVNCSWKSQKAILMSNTTFMGRVIWFLYYLYALTSMWPLKINLKVILWWKIVF